MLKRSMKLILLNKVALKPKKTTRTMLKQTFINLLKNYTDNESLINELWNEIELNYSSKKRYYHTLKHLEDLLIQMLNVKEHIHNWESVLFTLYYHDIIYNSKRSDNEELSAEFAEQRLNQLNVQSETNERCKQQILATKSHVISKDSDTNYFTDADLSILGRSWEEYSFYFKNVRKEYSIYPDFVYNPGRKKVLIHFLAMERIFKTDFFNEKFEKQARENLKREMDLY